MKKRIVLAAAASLFGIATLAQAAPATDKQWELTLSGAGNNDVDFDGTAFSVQAQVGYYLNDQNEVSVRQSIGFTDNGGTSTAAPSGAGSPGSSFDGATAIGYDYHFDYGQDQRLVPFIGASVGYRYGDLTDDSITAGLEGGAKYYVNDTTFIFGRVGYDFLLKESFGDGSYNYAVGVGFRW